MKISYLFVGLTIFFLITEIEALFNNDLLMAGLSMVFGLISNFSGIYCYKDEKQEEEEVFL